MIAALLRLLFVAVLCAGAAGARATLGDTLQQQIREIATEGAARSGAPRVDVEIGELDPRLKLAPCERIEPYLPPNQRAWGRTRIGLRCLQGATRWNVYLPVTVRVYANAWVATSALPAGTVLTQADLAAAEVDLAEEPGTALVPPAVPVGRTLARPLRAGQALRLPHLQPRQWFAAGEVVKVIARGDGFAVSGEAVALNPGIEGQAVRLKTDSGRVLTGQPIAERTAELPP